MKMKKILTSLLLIFIVAAMLFSIVKIEPVRAITFLTEGFESWNGGAWSVSGSGTQSDETGIVHGGSHSRKFVAAAGQNIFIYKYDFATTNLVNATFFLYLPSDLNIASGQDVNKRREIFEFWADMAEDWGIWNNSGTIESYVIGIDTVYLTNGTLSLGVWHSISVAVNITDVGWMKLAIDGSLVWQRNGDFYDADNTPSIYMGIIYATTYSPITCYLDDLTVTSIVTGDSSSTLIDSITTLYNLINWTELRSNYDFVGELYLWSAAYSYGNITLNQLANLLYQVTPTPRQICIFYDRLEKLGIENETEIKVFLDGQVMMGNGLPRSAAIEFPFLGATYGALMTLWNAISFIIIGFPQLLWQFGGLISDPTARLGYQLIIGAIGAVESFVIGLWIYQLISGRQVQD